MEQRDVAVALVLKHSEMSVRELSEFEGRKILQKIMYLLQEMPRRWGFGYSFNLYIRGPYSPALADSAYRLLEDAAGLDSIPPDTDLANGCLVDLNRVRTAFASPSGGFDAALLELAATVHFLIRHTYRYAGDQDRALALAQEWVKVHKPHLAGRLGEADEKLRKVLVL